MYAEAFYPEPTVDELTEELVLHLRAECGLHPYYCGYCYDAFSLRQEFDGDVEGLFLYEAYFAQSAKEREEVGDGRTAVCM